MPIEITLEGAMKMHQENLGYFMHVDWIEGLAEQHPDCDLAYVRDDVPITSPLSILAVIKKAEDGERRSASNHMKGSSNMDSRTSKKEAYPSS